MRAIAEPKFRRLVVAGPDYIPDARTGTSVEKGVISPLKSVSTSEGNIIDMYVDFLNSTVGKGDLKIRC